MAKDVYINLKPLLQMKGTASMLKKSSGRSRAVNSVMRLWIERYRAFAQRRFARESRGGGDWAPLAESTLEQRRKGEGKGKAASILWDTGSLIDALDPKLTDAPGAEELPIPWGVRVGYGGPERHPEGSATIADIAAFHQEGEGSLPKREIIVEPPGSVIRKMAQDLLNLLKRQADGKEH